MSRLPNGNSKQMYLTCLNYCPLPFFFLSNKCFLQIWTLKNCNQDIPKSSIAKSVKLGKLIEDETIVYLVKIQTNFVVVPFASLVFENL